MEKNYYNKIHILKIEEKLAAKQLNIILVVKYSHKMLNRILQVKKDEGEEIQFIH